MKRPSALRRSKRLTSVCVRTRKRRFASREDAERWIADAQWRREHGEKQRRERRAYACAGCEGWHVTSLGSLPKSRTPMPAASKKRLREQARRRRVLSEVFGSSPVCAVDGCGRFADDAHEIRTRARGGSITDPDNIVPLCRQHHDEITFRPESELGWAYEQGLLAHSWEAS